MSSRGKRRLLLETRRARSLVAERLARSRSCSPAAARSWSTPKTGALGHVGVAISFGLVIMVMIYAVGHISGAHFNPAVTFAFAVSRHFPWPRVSAYWAAQLAGALAAALVLRGSLGDIAHVGATLPSGLRRPGVPVGGRAHLLPHVRDHGRRHRHPRRRRGGRDRDRRDGRPGRHVRRADHRRLA